MSLALPRAGMVLDLMFIIRGLRLAKGDLRIGPHLEGRRELVLVPPVGKLLSYRLDFCYHCLVGIFHKENMARVGDHRTKPGLVSK